MKISSWNVNSVRARIKNIIEYLKDSSPDILMIQEIKTEDKTFPYEELTSDCLEIFKDWMKFEEENMLEPSLLKKVSIAEIQDKVESEKEEIDYVIENFGH